MILISGTKDSVANISQEPQWPIAVALLDNIFYTRYKYLAFSLVRLVSLCVFSWPGKGEGVRGVLGLGEREGVICWVEAEWGGGRERKGVSGEGVG